MLLYKITGTFGTLWGVQLRSFISGISPAGTIRGMLVFDHRGGNGLWLVKEINQKEILVEPAPNGVHIEHEFSTEEAGTVDVPPAFEEIACHWLFWQTNSATTRTLIGERVKAFIPSR